MTVGEMINILSMYEEDMELKVATPIKRIEDRLDMTDIETVDDFIIDGKMICCIINKDTKKIL